SAFPTESNPNATRVRTVQFGGQRFTPETNQEENIHIINTLYWTKGQYRITFGTNTSLTYLNTLLSNEQNGRFFFGSINDLENFNPTATCGKCRYRIPAFSSGCWMVLCLEKWNLTPPPTPYWRWAFAGM
ncbi:MAG: hypothetical protein HC880_17840, partial [Bacteroidia bacterium]|nr:hypothetical protein [Bacteroidia bacterium]